MRARAIGWASFAAAVLLCTVIYWGHFHGAFHFDDSHTIENNLYIRSLGNWKCFFWNDAEPCRVPAVTTFSALPTHGTYRPLITLSVALDYARGGGLDPFAFHVTNFVAFLCTGAMLFVVARRFVSALRPTAHADAWAALAAAWYLLHPVCAETVCYVIARSDIFSTLAVLTGIALWCRGGRVRRFHLYLVPVALGIFAKATTVMFLPLLALWVVFVQGEAAPGPESEARPRSLFGSRVRVLELARVLWPSAIVCVGGFGLMRAMEAAHFEPGGQDYWGYVTTQPFVYFHYFTQWLLPFHLSADSDWTVFRSKLQSEAVMGYLFVAALLGCALAGLHKDRLRALGFAASWFVVALAPTTFVALAEVQNDHRMFFPIVGLTLAGTVYLADLWASLSTRVSRAGLTLALVAALAGYGVGAKARTEVWRDSESLWGDVVHKSPGNGRGHMNYGIALLARGDLDGAEAAIRHTLALLPNYPHAHANLGIILDQRGRFSEAEASFQHALSLDTRVADVHYFYGRMLARVGRIPEAIDRLRAGLQVSNAHPHTRHLLLEVLASAGRFDELRELADAILQVDPANAVALHWRKAASAPAPQRAVPSDSSGEPPPSAPEAQEALSRGLAAYNDGRGADAVAAFSESVALEPKSARAWNNLCSAYNLTGAFSLAADACRKALALQPDFELARGNLRWALTRSHPQAP
jgi:Flp pilus assembly protein TadD